MTFKFSAPVTGFDATDVTTSEGTIGPLNQDLADDPTGETFTATFTPNALNNLDATVAVTAGSYQDASGNPGTAGSATITGDTLAPTVSSIAVNSSTINGANATSGDAITVTFSRRSPVSTLPPTSRCRPARM